MIEFSLGHGSLYKRMRTRSDQSRKILYLRDKETSKCVKNEQDKTKGFGFGVVSGEITRKR